MKKNVQIMLNVHHLIQLDVVMEIVEKVYQIALALLNALINTQFFVMMVLVGQLRIYVLFLLHRQNAQIKQK
jgi:hypothetical protein